MSARTEATRLAGITTLDLHGGRGPRTAYLLGPHRLALSAWAHALEGGPPATLLTMDRHLDTLVPREPARVPSVASGLRALDEHVRWELRTENNDHILAGMEAGVLADVVVVGRTVLPGAVTGPRHVDTRGVEHAVHVVPDVMALSDAWMETPPSPAVAVLKRAVEQRRLLLDVDLDAFTSPSDADPNEVLPWPVDVARRFLLPPDSARFWDDVLPACLAFTLALEPAHCGGVLAGDRLHRDLAGLLWEQWLGVPPP